MDNDDEGGESIRANKRVTTENRHTSNCRGGSVNRKNKVDAMDERYITETY